MSSISAKALLHFEQTPLENQETEALVADLELLTIGDHENAASNETLPIQNNCLFERIQRLDSDLHDQVFNNYYLGTRVIALEMQNCAPEYYYGYQRLAQVYVIDGCYAWAAYTYFEGQKKKVHGIELLRKSLETSLHIFDQAAAEFAKDKLFDEAHKIAKWMIFLTPTSPLGYLRAAELYEMRGIAKLAIEMCLQGMSRVSMDDRDMFNERITCLQQQINQTTYCDFIVQLPLEITYEIAQHLTVRQRIECLDVSKGWEDRFKQFPGAWCILDVERDWKKVNIASIKKIKRLVRQVTMKYDAEEEPFVKDMLISISNGEFENLTYLNLLYDTTTTQHYIPQLVKFDCINLTRLVLRFSGNDTEENHIPLHQVLRTCSHLKQLDYYSTFFPTRIDNELFPKVPPMITELSIRGYPRYEEAAVNSPYFIQLIPHFPHLVSLCIADSLPGELKTITEQCSNLRQLEALWSARNSSLDSSRIATSTPNGLQYLKVNGFTDPEDVASVIAYNSKTLISMEVVLKYDIDWDRVYIEPPPYWDYEHLARIDCPALKKLHFDTDYYWPFEAWIGDCPVLEDVRLVGTSSFPGSVDFTDSIFDACRRLPVLRSLYLGDCDELTDSGFSNFFYHMQTQGSQLHSVDIRYCALLGTKALLSLLALENLQNLSIDSCIGVTDDVFQEFAARVSISNRIESVNLNSLDGVKDQSLLQLVHSLSQLKQLNLICLDNITDNSVYDIADLVPKTNLTKITVNRCKQITPDAICYTKKLLNVVTEECSAKQ